MSITTAKRPSIVTDWSHSVGLVDKEGKLVPPRARKTFNTELLIQPETERADWQRLRTQVRQAEQMRLRSEGPTDRITEFVPMLTNYKAEFERRAREDFGECIFFTATKTRAWTFKHPNQIARYVPGHGYFLRVLSKLARYVQETPDDQRLSWKGFKEWLGVPAPGRKAEHNYPPGTLLARTGKCCVSVAVVCYVPPCASAEQRQSVEEAIAHECDALRHLPDYPIDPSGDDDDSVIDDDSELGARISSLVEVDSANESDEGATESPEGPPHSRATAELAPSDDEEVPPASDQDERPLNVNVLKRKILKEEDNVQTEERNIAVRKQNIAHWKELLKEHTDAIDARKSARGEELESMLGYEMLVDREGCEVDTTKEHRRVVAKYIRDLGTYADCDATLVEHFTSNKRHERFFTHERGSPSLYGGGFDAGIAVAQVRHDYLGHCDERKVVVVLEAKDECSYFNVGVAQMQLKRAEVSLQEFSGYTKFYHAAYATAPPRNDLQEHARLGHKVYSPDMTIDAKKSFFAPLKAALGGT